MKNRLMQDLTSRSVALLVVMTVLFAVSPALAKPSRIVCIDLAGAEILMLLQQQSKVVAVTHLAGDPANSGVHDMLGDIATIRGGAEEIVLLKPDLVIAGVYTQPSTVALLERLDIPYLKLVPARNFEEIRVNVRRIAGVVGAEEEGEGLIRDMDERLDRVRAHALARRPTVAWYYTGGNSVGSGTITHAIIEAAGGENLTATMGYVGNAKLTMEDMVLHAPEFLMFGKYLNNVHTRGTQILEHPALKKVLPDNRTIVLPSRLLSCTSPFAVDAVERLAAALAQRMSL